MKQSRKIINTLFISSMLVGLLFFFTGIYASILELIFLGFMFLFFPGFARLIYVLIKRLKPRKDFKKTVEHVSTSITPDVDHKKKVVAAMRNLWPNLLFSVIYGLLFIITAHLGIFNCGGGGGTDWSRGFIEPLHTYFERMLWYPHQTWMWNGFFPIKTLSYIVLLPLFGELCSSGLQGQLLIITGIFGAIYYNTILLIILKIIKK